MLVWIFGLPIHEVVTKSNAGLDYGDGEGARHRCVELQSAMYLVTVCDSLATDV